MHVPLIKRLCLIGYSSHAFVVAEIAAMNDYKLIGYFERAKKEYNPFDLEYLGTDGGLIEDNKQIENCCFFISVGNNAARKRIYKSLKRRPVKYAVLKHPCSTISGLAKTGAGSIFMASTTINTLVEIGHHAICNTGCIVEHECIIGNFVHIAPGAVLAGNVHVGEGSFIGANSTVRQGVSIGKNVTIGAGSVVVKDIPDNAVAYGNPAEIKRFNYENADNS